MYILFNQDTPGSIKKVVFHLYDQDAIFGPTEFAMITGLNFGVIPFCPTTSEFYNRIFKGKKSLVLRDVEDAFCQAAPESEERLKLSFLWLLYGLLAKDQGGKKLDLKYIHLMDNLDNFQKFPWVVWLSTF
ncbi:hypothetical protein ACS0TY_012870 [Phlomoides rotata]